MAVLPLFSSDARTGHVYAARDHMGIVPLYYGYDIEGKVWFASEMKALMDVVRDVQIFPPGHYYSSESDSLVQWYQPQWHSSNVPTRVFDEDRLRSVLERAVQKRMMSDVPWGVLLSGGLIPLWSRALLTRFAQRRVESGGEDKAWWPRVHSFCIGLTGSPDLAAAKK